MTLFCPAAGNFTWRYRTTDARPAAGIGTTVTASASTNTKGSWAELVDGALITQDVYWVEIQVTNATTAGFSRGMLLDIGIDESAGTSYTVIIPDLLVSHASTYLVLGGGKWFCFPLFIRAGSSIAARCQSSSGSQSCSVRMFLYGAPSNPEGTRVGYRVRAFGANTGTSRGTAVTAGTTSEGSWTSLGTTSDNMIWWQLGADLDDTSVAAVTYAMDLSVGDASNKLMAIEEAYFALDTSERMSINLHHGPRYSTSGDIVYARAQCSGTLESNLSMAAYGVVA